MRFGCDCLYREYPDQTGGWTVRGDMREEAVAGAARAAFTATLAFLNTHLH